MTNKINTADYTAEEIIQDLKENSIEKVLQKHNLTFKELIHIQKNKALTTDNKPRYITRNKKNNTYKITKVMDKKTHHYGTYNSLQDAQTIVAELKKHYWNKDKLETIKKKHNIKEYNEK